MGWWMLKGGEVLLRRICESFKIVGVFWLGSNNQKNRGGMSILHYMFFFVRVENAKVILFFGWGHHGATQAALVYLMFIHTWEDDGNRLLQRNPLGSQNMPMYRYDVICPQIWVYALNNFGISESKHDLSFRAMANEKHLGCLEHCTTQLYGVIRINHYKDPY